MKNLLLNTIFIFQIFVFIITLYYLILSFFGLYKKKDTHAINFKPQKKFALIVAAHNEETVVAQIIESLKGIDYPKELYDIFVIADNCNDATAEISRKCDDVYVFERNVPNKCGKGYALEWMFAKLFKMQNTYDAIGIFDADNLVSKNFLNEMNYKLCTGYKVVQGYIDSKNPNDSWITQCYSISFWSANRLFQLSRYNLGLSNQIGGTGFCVDVDVLKELGWGATCLTEDLEFTCKLVLNGYKVGWAHDAIVYDEKPLTLKQSWRQRKRWMQGFTDVSTRFFTKLIKKSFIEHSFVSFDCALYTIQPFVTLLIGVSAILTFIQNNSKDGLNIYVINFLFSASVWKAFSIFQFLFTPLVLVLEKKLSKSMFLLLGTYSMNIIIFSYFLGNNPTMVKTALANVIYIALFILFLYVFGNKLSLKIFIWYLLYGFYIITWIPITIEGIMKKNDKEWDHTSHTRVISIQDLE